MIQETFAIGDSIIHRLDPRVRVVFATLFSFLVALSDRFPTLYAAFGISVLMIIPARLDIREAGKRLKTLFWFMLLIWMVLPLTFEGDTIYRLGVFAVKRQGLVLCAQITLKAVSILLIFMALLSTMNINTLGHTLNRLSVPGKLVHLFLITYRYIFVIEEEYRRLRTAIKIRGFKSGTNLHSYKTHAYLLGMLFVRASIRAERVHEAMLCRGFHGRFYSLDGYKPSRKNRNFSIIMTAAIACLTFIEYYPI